MLPLTSRLLILVPLATFLALNLLFGWMAAVRPILSLVHLVYDANTLLFPVIFLGCGGAILLSGGEPARRRRAGVTLMVAGALLGVTRIYATHIEPRWLEVREEVLPASGLARPIRLLHISDIQSDAIGGWEERLVEEMRALEPDLIVNTGDLLHPIAPATVATELPKLTALIESLDPPLGVFTVDGDTDYWVRRMNPERIAGMRRLSSEDLSLDVAAPAVAASIDRRDRPSAAEILQDRSGEPVQRTARTSRAGASLRSGPPGSTDPPPAFKQKIRILGLPLDLSASPEAARLHVGRWLRGVGPDEFVIVAGHRPDFAMGMGKLRVDLALAGHTHGGQIRIPFYGPLVTLSKVPRDWARGFRRIGEPWLDVSAGLGAEHTGGMPSIRLNCRPEMTLITLQPR